MPHGGRIFTVGRNRVAPGGYLAPVCRGIVRGYRLSCVPSTRRRKEKKMGVIALLSRLNFSSCQACFPFTSCAKLYTNIWSQRTNPLIKICEFAKILRTVHRPTGALQPNQHVTSPYRRRGRGAGLDLHACNAHLNGDLLSAVHSLLQSDELFISQ